MFFTPNEASYTARDSFLICLRQESKPLPSSEQSSLPSSTAAPAREDVSEYVAHLQLHMALQARNLVPPLTAQQQPNQRHSMLQQTQADIEKAISRQAF